MSRRNVDRNAHVLMLFAKGFDRAHVARLLGITRGRVSQILGAASPEEFQKAERLHQLARIEESVRGMLDAGAEPSLASEVFGVSLKRVNEIMEELRKEKPLQQKKLVAPWDPVELDQDMRSILEGLKEPSQVSIPESSDKPKEDVEP